MYGRPGVIYGFHGCDRRVGETVLSSHTQHLKSSRNDYDWLGHGIYFWEASPERGLEFARAAKVRKKISQGRIRYPYVVGAVNELGNGLNLLDHAGLMEMRAAHQMLKSLICNYVSATRNAFAATSGFENWKVSTLRNGIITPIAPARMRRHKLAHRLDKPPTRKTPTPAAVIANYRAV